MDNEERNFDYKQIDEIIHSRIRLSIISILISEEKADFNFLKSRTGATDGNISVHLRKLEDAGYIEVEKRFQDRKPQTLYSLTSEGRKAFSDYLKTLEDMLNL
ncbi:MAG: transcriptional regulator [Candidatus Cloacimonetes bacterium]|nr:transcriptional regulator [Candidatus Cloacimonadota bacterium]